MPVRDGKAAQLREGVLPGDLGDGGLLGLRGEEPAMGGFEAPLPN